MTVWGWVGDIGGKVGLLGSECGAQRAKDQKWKTRPVEMRAWLRKLKPELAPT